MFRGVLQLILVTGMAIGALYSCNKGLPEPIVPEYPYSYYPLDSGKYWEYTVDSIIYHETTANDTIFWYVREVLVDTFYDLENQLNFTIERSRRKTLADSWEIVNTWSVQALNGSVIRNENNLRFIKLASPPINGVSWDGNAYLGGLDDLPFDVECNRLIFYEGWNYQYMNVSEPYTIPSFDFTNTLTVEQMGDSNLIWFDYAKEVYAEDVGMIEKTFKHYYTQDITCPDCPWEQRVQCGFSVFMQLTAYH